ncbi:MAG: hypothetical protein ISS45_00820 [Candidatus Omnitrophica bacterium]|nr:hypothetical protein [Candidatus Omnitrophota bacterium]
MKGIVCKVCSYISINGSAPEKCPVCGAPKTSFQEKQDAIKLPEDEQNLKEKHTPVIVLVKKCGLIGEGCVDVHVKVGNVEHPMLPEHHIIHIDFYIDNEFVSRIHLTPGKLHPAGALHFKATSGKLSVIELCNIHGAWIKEENL